MQENTAVQSSHPETAGKPPLSAIFEIQENTAALFFLHLEYSRGATTGEHIYEKGFRSFQTAKSCRENTRSIPGQTLSETIASDYICGLFIGGYEDA